MPTPLRPLSVPVPGLKRSIGLGDVVKKVTAAVGIRTCGGCARRAAALNRVVILRATNAAK
jgi:hypothetical protein